jgi:hypothetical protein
MTLKQNSTPSLSEFNPHLVPWQFKVIQDIRYNFDYSKGVHEVLLSGSIGSAKSLLMAHIVVTHCLLYPGARACLGRFALPDLKATIFTKIKEHLANEPSLIQGKHYKVLDQPATIKFCNGSEIISRSWGDGHFSKVRSLELSMLCIEELTENDNLDAYTELSMRVNRLRHVPEKLIIAATNPDSPSHAVHKYFCDTPSDTRHVYYSVTSDNPFLDPAYITKLKQDLDPKMYERMVLGKWVDIAGETIYYQYDKAVHFGGHYKINPSVPISFTWDFNVGESKPLSVLFGQYVNDYFHVFGEKVIEGLRTLAMMQEIKDSGWFNLPVPSYRLFGDATGKAGSTQSELNNYEIIHNCLRTWGVNFEHCVPPSNPPIKARHNEVNAHLKNMEGAVRMHLYESAELAGVRFNGAKTCSDGLQFSKLKPGASFIEDDSKPYQHISTALGYWVHMCKLLKSRGTQGTVRI